MIEFSPDELESVPCPGCGATGADSFRAVDDAPTFGQGEAACRVVECGECGLLYLNPRPRPDLLGRCYPDDYDCHAASDARERARRRRRLAWERDALAAFHGYPPGPTLWNRLSGAALWGLVDERRRADWIAWQGGGRALEFGCGAGDYLERLIGWGWQAEGLDASPNAVREAAARTGAPVHLGSLPHPDLALASFDLIVMRQALEHTPHPRAVLGAGFALLRPGGRLVLSVPNADGFGRRTFGADWFGWDLPRHLLHFTPRSLTTLLQSVGFRATQVETLPHPGWIAASARAVRPGPASPHQSLRRNGPARSAARRAARQGAGESLHAIAERPANEPTLS